MLENVILAAIVVTAAAFVGRRLFRALSPRKPASCGQPAPTCDGCASGCEPLVRIESRRKVAP
jgi:hypothetical protein